MTFRSGKEKQYYKTNKRTAIFSALMALPIYALLYGTIEIMRRTLDLHQDWSLPVLWLWPFLITLISVFLFAFDVFLTLGIKLRSATSVVLMTHAPMAYILYFHVDPSINGYALLISGFIGLITCNRSVGLLGTLTLALTTFVLPVLVLFYLELLDSPLGLDEKVSLSILGFMSIVGGITNQRAVDLFKRMTSYRQLVQQEKDEAQHSERLVREQAEQLRKIDKEKTTFFQNISHELRTPLTLILNPLESLSKRLPNIKEANVAAKNARRLLRLVNQLLDFQKLEAGKKELNLSPINLLRFVTICGDHFASACTSKEITFKVTLDGTEVEESTLNEHTLLVNAEIDALEKVAFNFLSNALKYTPIGGSIELGLTHDSGNIRLFIKDSGPGISEEGKKALFEVFSQVEDSTTREYEGTGLGLALAKSLVEKMGGQVGVESKIEKGSTFWADFPKVTSVELLPIRNILIVEDDVNFLEAMGIALEAFGLIELCKDAESARRKLQQYRFRIVLSDIRLPGEDGVSLLNHVRESHADSYRLLITGQADVDTLQKAINDAQAHKILYKPLSVRDDLEPLLKEYLSESKIVTEDLEATGSFKVKEWLLADADGQAGLDDETTGRFQTLDEATEEHTEGSDAVVLVVDDLSDMRDLISHMLRQKNYRVVTAPNGQRGVEMAHQIKPNLIITDWMMPQMSGPELIEKVREDESISGTPIILLTAKSDDESKLIGIEIGADAFLGKPFNAQELSSVVRNLLLLKANEQELRITREFLERMISSMDHALLVLDTDTTVIQANSAACTYLGLEETSLLKAKVESLLAPEDPLRVIGFGTLFADGQTVSGMVVDIQHPNGETSPVNLTATKMREGYLVELNDVTELREAAELAERSAAVAAERKRKLELSEKEIRLTKNLLVQAEKLSQLGQLVASIGHEISNPIMVVSMSAETELEVVNDLESSFMPIFTGSKEAEETGAKFQERLKSLRNSNECITTGAKKLADLSLALRTQSRMEQEITEGVPINEVVKESMVLVGGRMKRHSFEESLGQLPEITCYRSKIGQVVTNLLSNSADALTDKVERSAKNGGERFEGHISVLTQPCEHDGKPGVLVAVSDNGDGVPDSIREKIFEQFFTTKPAGVGTGLGLSMCAEIVAEHGGMLRVMDDENLGGARFELWLPVGGED